MAFCIMKFQNLNKLFVETAVYSTLHWSSVHLSLLLLSYAGFNYVFIIWDKNRIEQNEM